MFKAYSDVCLQSLPQDFLLLLLRPSLGSHVDICGACHTQVPPFLTTLSKEGLLRCQTCPMAFHPACLSARLRERAGKDGGWLCKRCRFPDAPHHPLPLSVDDSDEEEEIVRRRARRKHRHRRVPVEEATDLEPDVFHVGSRRNPAAESLYRRRKRQRTRAPGGGLVRHRLDGVGPADIQPVGVGFLTPAAAPLSMRKRPRKGHPRSSEQAFDDSFESEEETTLRPSQGRGRRRLAPVGVPPRGKRSVRARRRRPTLELPVEEGSEVSEEGDAAYTKGEVVGDEVAVSKPTDTVQHLSAGRDDEGSVVAEKTAAGSTATEEGGAQAIATEVGDHVSAADNEEEVVSEYEEGGNGSEEADAAATLAALAISPGAAARRRAGSEREVPSQPAAVSRRRRPQVLVGKGPPTVARGRPKHREPPPTPSIVVSGRTVGHKLAETASKRHPRPTRPLLPIMQTEVGAAGVTTPSVANIQSLPNGLPTLAVSFKQAITKVAGAADVDGSVREAGVSFPLSTKEEYLGAVEERVEETSGGKGETLQVPPAAPTLSTDEGKVKVEPKPKGRPRLAKPLRPAARPRRPPTAAGEEEGREPPDVLSGRAPRSRARARPGPEEQQAMPQRRPAVTPGGPGGGGATAKVSRIIAAVSGERALHKL